MRSGRARVTFVAWLFVASWAAAVWLTSEAAHAQMLADKPVVYNHITSSGAAMDQLVHQTFDAEFKVIDFSDLEGDYVAPRLRTGSLPKAPFDERGAPVEGEVVVIFIVSSDGRAVKPVIIRSTDPRLNHRVIEAMADWAFDPARVKGESASTTAAQEFELKAAIK